MAYRRRVLRYGPSPEQWQGALEDRVIAGCVFELHRWGGCGRGQLTLADGFAARGMLSVGEWIACEYDDGERWYLGRIEERRAESPAGVQLRLEGMSIQLNEVFPGGFGSDADGVPPHRYARTDRFAADPDHAEETADDVARPEELVRLLLSQYVVPATDIQVEEGLIEETPIATPLVSAKFNGEESVRSILKDLALRLRNASWGVDELGRFFLLQPRTTDLVTFQEGVDLIELREETTREALYNRVLLTGGYVYGTPAIDGAVTAAVRWRGTYHQPASVQAHGERRLRLWVPWLRTAEDSRQFVREFFRVYAQPALRYRLEGITEGVCPRPWLGRVRVLDRGGNVLIEGQPETVRVRFDNVPRFTIEVGPEDPRTHWPEPPHDERYPILKGPAGSGLSGGGPISLTNLSNGSGGGGGGGSSGSGPATSQSLTSDELTSSGLTSSAVSSSGTTSSSSGGTDSLTSDSFVATSGSGGGGHGSGSTSSLASSAIGSSSSELGSSESGSSSAAAGSSSSGVGPASSSGVGGNSGGGSQGTSGFGTSSSGVMTSGGTSGLSTGATESTTTSGGGGGGGHSSGFTFDPSSTSEDFGSEQPGLSE
jgi:hypothetical protein